MVFKYKKVCTSCILLLLSLFYEPTGSVFFMLWPTKQIIKLVSPYVDSQPIWFEYCFFSRYHLKFACVMARVRNTSLGKKVSVFGVILVRIFQHSDWIRRDSQSECGKMRTRITPNMDTFHTVCMFLKVEKNLKSFDFGATVILCRPLEVILKKQIQKVEI